MRTSYGIPAQGPNIKMSGKGDPAVQNNRYEMRGYSRKSIFPKEEKDEINDDLEGDYYGAFAKQVNKCSRYVAIKSSRGEQDYSYYTVLWWPIFLCKCIYMAF